MPLTKARRPKYERQDVKQNLFSIQLSNQRINKIQRLLKDKEVDALLIIIGIDGRFNSGSLEVFNYLLFDAYNTRRDDIDRSKLDDDVFDDVMLCIQMDEVHVCCNGANYWLLLPYISHWQGLRLHCITELEMEDPDKVEDFKMKTFVEMTRRCSKIAVSIRAQYEADNEPFDPMQLEDWPIVQSYAYDDFGKYSYENAKKGFFTLVHKVVDLSSDISRICRQVDPVNLENVYIKILPQIEGLFENIFQLIDTKCFSKEFEINEDALEEPVQSYFSHYKGVNVCGLEKIKIYPFVVIGTNTRKEILNVKMNNQSKSKKDKVVKNPTHLIIQCVSLQSGIVITRTAFLKCSTDHSQETSIIDDNTRILSKVYRDIISTVEYVIDSIKKGRKCKLDSVDGTKYLNSKLDGSQYSECSLKIIRVNDESQRDCSVIIIHGAVFDVVNEISKINLGSVMFADTFTVVCSPLRKDEDLNAVLRLGIQVPIFNYWVDQRLSELHNNIKRIYQLEAIGTENVEIFLPNDNFHEDFSYNACCTFYSDRVLLFNRRIGSSLIYPQSVEILEGESYGDWTICTLNYQRDETSSNWIWNSNEQCCLHLVFTNHSNARKFIINGVIPRWKETISVTQVDKLRCANLAKSWGNIQSWMTSHQLPNIDGHSQSIIDGISDDTNRSSLIKHLQSMNNSLSNRRSCVRIFCRFMELAYALHYLNTVSNIEKISVKNAQFYLSLESSWETVSILEHSKLMAIKNGTSDIDVHQSVIVTVLCGLPGSGHELVSRKITKLIKEDISWILVDAYTVDLLPSAVERAICRICKLETSDEGRQMRMILMAPPMCSPAVVCQILSGLKTKIPLEIGSTCLCIDPQSAYLDGNELTIPGLLDMCNEGWVTCILLTGSDDNSVAVNNLHRLLQSRNELCTIFRTPKAEVNKELDTILSPVAFQQSRFASSRILIGSYLSDVDDSVKYIRRIAPEWFQVTFPLCGNLLKENIVSVCKDISKNLNSCPFDRNIYFIDGIFGLEEDPRFQFSFHAVSSTKYISFLPLAKKPSGDENMPGNYDNFIKIYTININYDENDSVKIENWRKDLLSTLQKCQRQRPEKKAKLTHGDITKVREEDIHRLRHLEPLPEGWFYNGLTFVHMDGSKSDKHPNLHDFIEEYLIGENVAIDQHNADIDKMIFVDSFCKF